MIASPWVFFTDPVLRAPTIGCMLMSLSASLVGVVIFLRRESLLGEAMSHSAYPGVILGVILAALLNIDDSQGPAIPLFIMGGAFLSALCGVAVINMLVHWFRVKSDSALCFVLSAFFGIGLTLASHVQFAYSALYLQVPVYLYGQAATMTDLHIAIYGLLSLLVLAIILLLFKELQVVTLDRDFAKSIGIPARRIDAVILSLAVLSIVIGIRSVGVVLMSAMLIAPAASARQYTNKFSHMLALAGVCGLISGYAGNYLSVEISQLLAESSPDSKKIALPTGPMIVLVASFLCIFSLLFAPERGLMLRMLRIGRFRQQCLCENILKALWRAPNNALTLTEIANRQSVSRLYLRYLLFRLKRNGWIESTTNAYALTKDGLQWAAKIVRLHRLWELYLANYLGMRVERVHRSAEEMEHIITPELEEKLTELLHNPKEDPHHQPIPPKHVL